MIVIGLGNNDQATELHSGSYPRRMCELMPAVSLLASVYLRPKNTHETE